MSGSILNQISLLHLSQNFPLLLAKKLGYTGSDEDRDVLEYLRNADPIRMAEEQHKIVPPEYILFPFLPNIEPDNSNAFITKSPVESCRTAWSNDIDILIGGTADEGMEFLTFIARDPTILTSLDLNYAIPYDINVTDKDIRAKCVERIRKFYYGPNEPTEDKIAYCKVNFVQYFLQFN